MAITGTTSSTHIDRSGHISVGNNPMDGQERKMRFVVNFLKMLSYVVLFAAAMAIGSIAQIVVNGYGVPLWLQWSVGLVIMFCCVGALVLTTSEKLK